MIRGFRYHLVPPIRRKGLEWIFFSAILLSLSFTALTDVSNLFHRSIAPGALTEGQREMAERARVIQEVLSKGELELTPGRYFKVLEDPNS